jgi:hypothetical protein
MKVWTKSFAAGALCSLVGVSGIALGEELSFKFTAEGLGLGTSDINTESVVDYDLPGFYTSPNTGEGSVLQVQRSGLAGAGSADDPVFMTITAKTHQDTFIGLPDLHDYHAGIITMTDENSREPDGRDEGLGVKAFRVDAEGLREFSNDRARTTGDDEISGGTGIEYFNMSSRNNVSKDDEALVFSFNPADGVRADGVELLFSSFRSNEIIDLRIECQNRTPIELAFQGTWISEMWEEIDNGDKLWKLHLSGVPGIGASDVLVSLEIRSNDNDPEDPEDEAQSFRIAAMTATMDGTVDAAEVPSTVQLLPNHPNPFNPVTTLRYSLEQTSHATLAVYNLAGHRVATLVDGLVVRGQHDVSFDASGLPSGLYISQLEADGFVETRKLMLMK